MDIIRSKINYSLLNRVRVCIFQGYMINESMDEDEDVSHPTVIYDIVFNTLMEISQQNVLAIQNLEKDMTIIKR